MNYEAAIRWLYATQQFGIKLGLENTHRLLALLGNPERRCRFLHVAGTNGKGSTCAMLDAILRAAGFRTGLYTSPHLVDFRERVRVNGEEIGERRTAELLTLLRDGTAGWEHAPTYFELATALAIRHFADEGTDHVVLETGMGGRLDATNAVTPVVSVITPIGMDHMQWLGDTLEKIAAEKAGIIKPGVPVVSAPQEPAAAAVLRERGAVEFVSAPVPEAWSVGLRGRYQRWNAALAVAALRAARIPVSEEAVRSGLANVVWPGRFQQLGPLVLDGAHNAHGAAHLVRTWREEFGDAPVRIIFGAMRDKDRAEILAALEPIAREFWFVPVDSPRSETPATLAGLTSRSSLVFPSLAEALRANGAERGLVTGSLFLVGEALAILTREGGTPGEDGDPAIPAL